MAKFRMKAETGKFGIKGGEVPNVYPIQGDQVVVGVVAMHNMLMAMARALDASQTVLTQMRAVVDENNNYLETSINVGQLDIIIDGNAEILESINVK